MKFKTKNLIFIGIFLLILLGSWQNCQAVDLLLNYPDVGGEKLSNTSSLPQLINYIYKFALLACGLTALVSILIGAIQYVTSAGDSSKAGNARDRITSALLGILILLTSVLILRTINPDLVILNLTLPTTNTPTTGNYKCLCCCWTTTTCTPISSIALVNPPTKWGTQDCKNVSSSVASKDCKNACSNDACNLCGDPQRGITCKAESKTIPCN